MSEQNEIKRLSSIIERKDIEIQDIKTSERRKFWESQYNETEIKIKQ